MSEASDRILREFRRYSGDGIAPAASGELPIGDPRSGVHMATLAEWRELFGLVEDEAASAAAHKTAAEAAAALAQAFAGEAVSQGNVPIYGTVTSVGGLPIPLGITAFRVNGFASQSDGGGGFYAETLTETTTTTGVIADGSSPTRYFKLQATVANVRTFGAVGDGVADDRVAIQKAIDFALAQKIPLVFPRWKGNGRYLINSAGSTNPARCVTIDAVNSDLDIFCDADIVVGNGIYSQFTSGTVIALLTTTTSATHSRIIRWRGGRIDASGLSKPTTAAGLGAISYFPGGRYDIEGVVFDGGTTTPTDQDNMGAGGCDTLFGGKGAKFVRVHGCQFIGGYDSGIYINGDQDGSTPAFEGYAGIITGNRFERCGNGISLKRKVRDTFIGYNFIQECGNGINFGDTGDATDGQGIGATIVANRFRRIQGTPIGLHNTDSIQIIGNDIVDWRRLIANGLTETAVAATNYAGAVRMEGARFCTVVGNTFRYRDWAPVTTSQKQSYGVTLQGYNPELGGAAVESAWNVVAHNVISGTYGPILANANGVRSILGPNVVTSSVLNPSVVQGVGNRRPGDRVEFSPNLTGTLGSLNGANYDERIGEIVYGDGEVTVRVRIDMNAVSGLNGTVTITSSSIPAAIGPISRYAGAISLNGITNSSAAYTGFSCDIDAGTNAILLFETGSGVKQALTHARFGADSRLSLSITYRVD